MIKNLKHVLCSCLISISLISFGQNSNTPKKVTNTYLIKNVFITSNPDVSPTFGSVLIKNGLIHQVGAAVAAPFDAEIIDGDSMYIYPGFIDALSHTAIKSTDDEDRPKAENPGNPPNDLAGIMPNRSAFSMLSSEESSLKDMRKAGICISHVVPKGNMLPGNGAIILTDGDSPEALTVKKDVSIFSQFKGASRMYPATIIGVMAKWRELYRRAEIAIKHVRNYNMNPSGLSRPNHDKELEALFPVVDKTKKVFFKASKTQNIYRALSLQKDLGFPIVLTEVQHVSNALNKIKSAKAGVLLSLKLPKEEKKKEEKEEDDKEEGQKDDSGAKKEKKKDTDPEKEALEKRKKESVKSYLEQASILEKNNIPFGFSFIDGKAKDLLPNVRRMIEAGLSEKAALKAMTIYPAKILGIDNICGSLDKGKIANLVMSDKPIFDEKTKLKYVFVEGNPFKMEEKKKKASASDEDAADIVGKWSYEMDIPMPDNTGIILISKTEDGHLIKIASVDDLTDFEEIEDAELDGDNLSFSFDVDNDGMTMNIGMDLNFSGESFEGTITPGAFGTFNITGNRTSKTPEKR